MARCEVDGIDLAQDVTMVIRVRRLRQFRIRCWLAIALIRLAAWIVPTSAAVLVEDDA